MPPDKGSPSGTSRSRTDESGESVRVYVRLRRQRMEKDLEPLLTEEGRNDEQGISGKAPDR
jgi:hypothetical protein